MHPKCFSLIVVAIIAASLTVVTRAQYVWQDELVVQPTTVSAALTTAAAVGFGDFEVFTPPTICSVASECRVRADRLWRR